MRGKLARRMRKDVEKLTGINPIGSTPTYTSKKYKYSTKKQGVFEYRETLEHLPTSPKGIYKAMKFIYKTRGVYTDVSTTSWIR